MRPASPRPRLWQAGGLDYAYTHMVPVSGGWPGEVPQILSLDGVEEASSQGFPSFGYVARGRSCHLVLRRQVKPGERDGYPFSVLLDPGASRWEASGFHPGRLLRAIFLDEALERVLGDPGHRLDEGTLDAAMDRLQPVLEGAGKGSEPALCEAWCGAWVEDWKTPREAGWDGTLESVLRALDGLPAFLRMEVSWIAGAGPRTAGGFGGQVVLAVRPPDAIHTRWMEALKLLMEVQGWEGGALDPDPPGFDRSRFRGTWKSLAEWLGRLKGDAILDAVLRGLADLALREARLEAPLSDMCWARLEAKQNLSRDETTWCLERGHFLPAERMDASAWQAHWEAREDLPAQSVPPGWVAALYHQRFLAAEESALFLQFVQAISWFQENDPASKSWLPDLASGVVERLGAMADLDWDTWRPLFENPQLRPFLEDALLDAGPTSGATSVLRTLPGPDCWPEDPRQAETLAGHLLRHIESSGDRWIPEAMTALCRLAGSPVAQILPADLRVRLGACSNPEVRGAWRQSPALADLSPGEGIPGLLQMGGGAAADALANRPPSDDQRWLDDLGDEALNALFLGLLGLEGNVQAEAWLSVFLVPQRRRRLTLDAKRLAASQGRPGWEGLSHLDACLCGGSGASEGAFLGEEERASLRFEFGQWLDGGGWIPEPEAVPLWLLDEALFAKLASKLAAMTPDPKPTPGFLKWLGFFAREYPKGFTDHLEALVQQANTWTKQRMAVSRWKRFLEDDATREGVRAWMGTQDPFPPRLVGLSILSGMGPEEDDSRWGDWLEKWLEEPDRFGPSFPAFVQQMASMALRERLPFDLRKRIAAAAGGRWISLVSLQSALRGQAVSGAGPVKCLDSELRALLDAPLRLPRRSKGRAVFEAARMLVEEGAGSLDLLAWNLWRLRKADLGGEALRQAWRSLPPPRQGKAFREIVGRYAAFHRFMGVARPGDLRWRDWAQGLLRYPAWLPLSLLRHALAARLEKAGETNLALRFLSYPLEGLFRRAGTDFFIA